MMACSSSFQGLCLGSPHSLLTEDWCSSNPPTRAICPLTVTGKCMAWTKRLKLQCQMLPVLPGSEQVAVSGDTLTVTVRTLAHTPMWGTCDCPHHTSMCHFQPHRDPLPFHWPAQLFSTCPRCFAGKFHGIWAVRWLSVLCWFPSSSFLNLPSLCP